MKEMNSDIVRYQYKKVKIINYKSGHINAL